ncbi:MAG: cysteine desulfurase [Gammaproteobacteria bacterium]|nr:MAG: cysteine desulfurase [Gammaproteobacteria bacterium]
MIYLDHNASTPLQAQVLEAMRPFLEAGFANPSSRHRLGRQVRGALEEAREKVASLVNVHPRQVVFTSGGTEANNLAIKGMGAERIAISAIEHPSVNAPARALGVPVITLPVDGEGRVSPEVLAESLARGVGGVSVMMANNETGVLQDIPGLAQQARRFGAVFHTDAVQAAGKVAVDFEASGAHLMSLSAHKLGGPKGAGALILEEGLPLNPLLHGGGHEQGLRSGTENVAAIVGFGEAARLASENLEARQDHLLALREDLEGRLRALGAVIFSEGAKRLPNTVMWSLPGIDGETLLMALDEAGFAVSSGSACGSRRMAPSHVLDAMGIAGPLAQGAIRVSLGMDNTLEDLDAFERALKQCIKGLRSPALWAWDEV